MVWGVWSRVWGVATIGLVHGRPKEVRVASSVGCRVWGIGSRVWGVGVCSIAVYYCYNRLRSWKV